MLHDQDVELYWKRIRSEQFLLPEWRVFLNNGSLGVAPRPVLAASAAYETAGAARTSDEYPRWGYETLDPHRTEMARFLGCNKDELAFTHNCTESMSIIANGLDLRAGDEVLMTDQEHPSGRGPWYMKQARYGIQVREVALPSPPKSSAQIAELIIGAIGPKTRVISFSGILTTTGLIMPVREICDAARAKGIISVVDGAHLTGQVSMPISEMHCDFFAGSPHKWLFAPPASALHPGRNAGAPLAWNGYRQLGR
ncbi:MAG: aminotransferase class V-fold PLP-dependent enzyme [Bryobacteraceae bacterium]